MPDARARLLAVSPRGSVMSPRRDAPGSSTTVYDLRVVESVEGVVGIPGNRAYFNERLGVC